ncbi:hypothetical protein DTL00_11785 [Sphingomonas melonis]
MVGEHRANLARLDAKAANLHLVVDPAEMLKLTGHKQTPPVAAAIQSLPRDGVHRKSLKRQIVPADIADR